MKWFNEILPPVKEDRYVMPDSLSKNIPAAERTLVKEMNFPTGFFKIQFPHSKDIKKFDQFYISPSVLYFFRRHNLTSFISIINNLIKEKKYQYLNLSMLFIPLDEYHGELKFYSKLYHDSSEEIPEELISSLTIEFKRTGAKMELFEGLKFLVRFKAGSLDDFLFYIFSEAERPAFLAEEKKYYSNRQSKL